MEQLKSEGVYEYAFFIHEKAVDNKALRQLLSFTGRMVMDFTESEFNEFRVQCMLLSIELCEIERNLKPSIESVL